MKCRYDYVTNSSSSSFILGFKDEDDYLEFKNYCLDMNYEPILKLVEKIRKLEKQDFVYGLISKEEALNIISSYHERELKEVMYKEYIPNYYKLNWNEKVKAENEISKTEKFKSDLKTRLELTYSYSHTMEKIEKDTLFLFGEIYDYNGGILEYAIRNGIMENEFGKWCLLNYNIG